jgi:hypothetical protein
MPEHLYKPFMHIAGAEARVEELTIVGNLEHERPERSERS